MSSPSPIWITGVGAATPLGHSFDTIADALLAGRSGIGKVADFDVTEHPCQIAGQVGEIPCPPDMDPEAFAKCLRLEQVVLWCCAAALRDSGWWERRRDVRLGLVLGMGAEWSIVWEGDSIRGGNRVYDPKQDSESILSSARRKLEISGPVASVSAACASGNYALALGRRWLELGWVDVCLADVTVHPLAMRFL